MKYILFYESIYSEILNFNAEFMASQIYEYQKSHPSTQNSNRGGWQSPSIETPENVFMREVLNSVYDVMDTVYTDMAITTEPKLSNYWFNINKKYNYNLTHCHPGSWFSAVLYIKVPKNSGDIIFKRTENHSYYRVKSENSNNEKFFRITPEPNMFVVFPSYLEHFVEQNLTNDESDDRVSIAFNFI